MISLIPHNCVYSIIFDTNPKRQSCFYLFCTEKTPVISTNNSPRAKRHRSLVHKLQEPRVGDSSTDASLSATSTGSVIPSTSPKDDSLLMVATYLGWNLQPSYNPTGTGIQLAKFKILCKFHGQSGDDLIRLNSSHHRWCMG